MFLLLYGDDMALTGNNNEMINKLLISLNSEFKMKDLGLLHYFLRNQAHFYPEGLFLSQEKYATDLLITAGMANYALMPTHLPLQLNKFSGQDKAFSDPTYYRSLAGKLQILTLTRSYLQFAVNYVC